MVTDVSDTELQRMKAIAESVPDPELPMVNIGDLGMVREVARSEDGFVVALTPTYSGCPATEMIQTSVERDLREAGWSNVRVVLRRSPAWTTDWITEAGREKLRNHGIAPPALPVVGDGTALFVDRKVSCPWCGSFETERLAEHGATPCKALYRCTHCREPFDHFKCH
ncbi:MAG: 1,2-phenylacetyl-CoA epoxidase subunit PaaD [Myxococcota bacterium]